MVPEPYAMCNGVILETRSLTRRFGGVVAINELNLVIKNGELRCIIGPNGAGKSTLFNLVMGLIRPTSGSVLFSGSDITGMPPDRVSRLGIGRKFQIPNVFLGMTVDENLRLALHGKQGLRDIFRKSRESDDLEVENALSTISLLDKAGMPASSLSHGEKQWLEIGMVLIENPLLMLLDEPTAGMSPEETSKTANMIKKISERLTVVVIEHDINFIREIAGIVTVLHRGCKLAEGTLGEIADNEEVKDVYFGKNKVCLE